jgi:hypothetical protein
MMFKFSAKLTASDRLPRTSVAEALRNASALMRPAHRRQNNATGVVTSSVAGASSELSALARPLLTSRNMARA